MTKKKKEKKTAISQEKLAELIRKAGERDEYFNKSLMAHADLDNARKRLERERGEIVKFATEQILLEMIPAVENLDRAVDSAAGAENNNSILKGLQMIQAQFHDLLNVSGVKKIETKGHLFNPLLHEAVEIVESNNLPENTILEELQPGYTLNSKVIKHAFVRVSKKKEESKPETSNQKDENSKF